MLKDLLVQTWRDTADLAASSDECCFGSSGPTIPAEPHPELDWERKCPAEGMVCSKISPDILLQSLEKVFSTREEKAWWKQQWHQDE
ncbi:hypothetical protein EYF80_031481 [Liparis tanakae]|uniref:Uncharacterized protein n=1 Tax=Liparis tanakae TaxID=230148 RepID=A0A4Z2GXI3_9TELE|nr:hypothetical protein EYF80_031481 [Liparis tanakae]